MSIINNTSTTELIHALAPTVMKATEPFVGYFYFFPKLFLKFFFGMYKILQDLDDCLSEPCPYEAVCVNNEKGVGFDCDCPKIGTGDLRGFRSLSSSGT